MCKKYELNYHDGKGNVLTSVHDSYEVAVNCGKFIKELCESSGDIFTTDYKTKLGAYIKPCIELYSYALTAEAILPYTAVRYNEIRPAYPDTVDTLCYCPVLKTTFLERGRLELDGCFEKIFKIEMNSIKHDLYVGTYGKLESYKLKWYEDNLTWLRWI